MAMMFTLQGFNDATYAAIKTAAAQELSFPVTVRRHTAKTSWHLIDIRPTARTQHYLSEDQGEELRDFCARHGLDTSMRHIGNRDHWHPCCFLSGIHYLGILHCVGMALG